MENYYLLPNLSKSVTKQLGDKYYITVQTYKTEEGCWDYTSAIVTDIEGNVITTIKRNYSDFYYEIVENHPITNHDYLICGEDYQGQTIVNLSTKEKVSYIPPEARKGGGLCWIGLEPSPDKLKLLVEACYWGGPYDLYLYDFSNPMELPYKQLKVLTSLADGPYKWIDNNTLKIVEEVEIRKSDNKRFDELTDEEQDYLDNNLGLTDWIKVEKIVKL